MRSLLLLTTCLLLCACQSNKAVVDYDTETDFSRIRYFDWLKQGSGAEQGFEPLVAERTRSAVHRELARNGLLQSSTNNEPDILVRYYVATFTRDQPSNTSGSIGIGGGSHSSIIGVALSFPLGGNKLVKEAQIMVDLVSPVDNKLKWRGSHRIKISDQTPQQITALINAAVAEIFSHYPPAPRGQ